MKRAAKGLCGLVLGALLLTACGGANQAATTASMSIAPAELNTQAQNVADSFAQNTKLFQYTTDDSIGAVNVTMWRYEKNGWEPVAQGEFAIDEPGTHGIGIQLSGKTFRVIFCDADWEQIGSYAGSLDFSPLREADKYTSGELYSAFEKQEIAADQEILLWASIGGDETDLNQSDFRKSKCEAGVAVTATFLEHRSSEGSK